jgi:predicted transcriptional regulator
MNKRLTDLLHKAEDWPAEAQSELADIARQIDAELNSGAYQATPEELAGIDRGLRDADQARFATDDEVEAVFAKHRRS